MHLFTTLYFLISLARSALGSSAEKKLLEDILKNYNPAVRPVQLDKESVNVTLNMRLYQLISIKEKEQVMEVAVWIRQIWSDHQLKWNPDDYNGISEINLRSESIWTPDIVMYNNVDDSNAEFGGNLDTLRTRVVVYHTGTMLWMAPLIIKARCEISVRYFPFDLQNCYLKFGSWTYDQARLDIRSTNFDVSRYQTNLEWHMETAKSSRIADEYDGIYYPTITFHLAFHRRSLFHILNLIFPIALITLLTIATFILPDESGERLSVSVTLMLATTVFMLLVAEKIPESSESVPLVGIFFMFCMVEMFFIIVAICCISRLYHRTSTDGPMSQWMQKYILGKLSYVVGTRRDQQISRSAKSTSPDKSEEKKGSYEIAPLNNKKSNIEELSKAIQGGGEKIEQTEEDEWRVVAATIDRCLLIFFTFVFVVACMACFIGTRYVR